MIFKPQQWEITKGFENLKFRLVMMGRKIHSHIKKTREKKEENLSYVAEIINHTQVTIINDIQHDRSNVEWRHRMKNGNEGNLCLIWTLTAVKKHLGRRKNLYKNYWFHLCINILLVGEIAAVGRRDEINLIVVIWCINLKKFAA